MFFLVGDKTLPWLPISKMSQGWDAAVPGVDRGAEEGEVCKLDAQEESCRGEAGGERLLSCGGAEASSCHHLAGGAAGGAETAPCHTLATGGGAEAR